MSLALGGVFPDQAIRQMIERKEICSVYPVESDQIQPASLDCRLGETAYRVRTSFLAGKDSTVKERLERYCMHKVDLTNGAVLEKGCVYVVPLLERLNLPEFVNGVANAKSSTGRLDLLVRLVTDRSVEFDRIVDGYRGPVYAEICPKSFSVLAKKGIRLNQIRFRRGESSVTDRELAELNTASPIVDGEADISDGLGFSVDLSSCENGIVGYCAKRHAGVIDLSKKYYYDSMDFFTAVEAPEGKLILDPGSFYILISREEVAIPPGLAAEMVPYLAMAGEFRVHYAGFFDPGFGYSKIGDQKSRSVLEVRCHEVPFLLEHRQTVGRLRFERMLAEPAALYGSNKLGSSYQGQKLALSKHFRR
ncbi:MAG: 2'-deoxycytidine 5'-triphosphate deaminase [Albidovulum sp.]|nr:2'-deoxycytidine 5'-triphosphate deaminase [Albidovulum sp.]